MAVPSMMSVPEELMDRLVCIKCGNVLSVCPVYTLPNEDAICGRCVDLKNQDGIRNRSYEILLEILTFPCMNKKFGCMENRTGKNMYEHEQKCLHRRINCPTFASTSCDWFGEIDNLLEHFENNHVLNLMKEPSFEVNFVHKFEEVSLLPYADSLFIVTKLGEPQKKIFWCSVQNIFKYENEKFEYFLTLKNPSNGLEKQLPRKEINLNNIEGIQVQAEEINKDLENPSTIVASIDILEYKKPSQQIKEKGKKCLTESNLEMLKIIECPVCFDYMVPPIYQCCGGHSICGECKSQVQQCPTCEKPFGETQNFAVESFTTFLTYPCKNSERGCDFLSPAKEIRHHEKLCIFGCYECPTSAYTHCKWFGLNQDIWQHCREQHADNVMENPVISLPFDMEEDLDTEDDDCFILKFRKNIFILHWEYREQSIFRWSLQLVGPTEESKNYSFDLDIIDRSGRNQRIYIKSLCESFTHKDLAFQDNKTFIYLTLDQVKPLLNEVFCFKISVYENQ